MGENRNEVGVPIVNRVEDLDGAKAEVVVSVDLKTDGPEDADVLVRAFDRVMVHSIPRKREFVEFQTLTISFGAKNLNGNVGGGTGVGVAARR